MIEMYEIVLKDREFALADVGIIRHSEGFIYFYDEKENLICAVNETETILIRAI